VTVGANLASFQMYLDLAVSRVQYSLFSALKLPKIAVEGNSSNIEASSKNI